jgi:hypothetical protein
MNSITKPTNLYCFLRPLLERNGLVARYPKRLVSFATFLVDDRLPGSFDREDLEGFFEDEDDLFHPLATAFELLYLQTVDNAGDIDFPVAKMRLAMWIVNAAVEYEYVDHLSANVAMIRYLGLDRQDYLRYWHRRDGLRVISGKKFERDYGVRVRLRPPNNLRV